MLNQLIAKKTTYPFKMNKVLILIIFFPGFIYSQIDTTYINKLNSKAQKTGVWKEYIFPDEEQNTSDTLIGIFTYKNNLKNGPFEVYKVDKTILVKGNYINGETHGEIINYYPNGNIEYRFNITNNTFNGPYTSYGEDGKVKTSKFYENGEPIGTIKHYYKDGPLWIEIVNQNPNKQLWIFYHKNGNIKAEGMKENDENIGTWKEYSEEGILIKETKY